MKEILIRVRHVTFKLLAFFIFGVGAVFLAGFIFSFYKLSTRNPEECKKAMRRSVSHLFGLHVRIMKGFGLIQVRFQGIEKLQQARQMIICANHPTFIDVVLMISLVPSADCVVNSNLWKNPFIGPVVKTIFISNSLSAEDTLKDCALSLAQGNNLVIFPEGTRTPRNQEPRLQRSAAQIALRTGFSILPLRIRVPDSMGLGKGDSLFSAPDLGVMTFDIEVLEPLSPQNYPGDPSIASRALTADLNNKIISLS